jgi:hypothetical protein
METESIFKFLEKYGGRRIELLLTDGQVMRGRVGGICEPDEFWEESDGDLNFGFELSEIDIDGEPLTYDMDICETSVVSFTPLDGENSEEEIKRLFAE